MAFDPSGISNGFFMVPHHETDLGIRERRKTFCDDQHMLSDAQRTASGAQAGLGWPGEMPFCDEQAPFGLTQHYFADHFLARPSIAAQPASLAIAPPDTIA